APPAASAGSRGGCGRTLGTWADGRPGADSLAGAGRSLPCARCRGDDGGMSAGYPSEDPVARTRQWLERAVIGLNLCPFAKAVTVRGQVRFVLSDATTPEALLEALAAELEHLRDAAPEETDTTLL